jgi:hypothetical protein
MKLKKQEFLALKQGVLSVNEYMEKFIQLSCYAPVDVADDAEKQDHFRDGLIGPIKYQLMVHTFENFQKMVDNAIMVEHACKEMGEQKRKFESSGQFSNNSRPRFAPPQGTPFRTRGQGVNYGQNQNQRPNQQNHQQQGSACWSVSAASQFSAKSPEHPYWNTCEEQYPCFHWW